MRYGSWLIKEYETSISNSNKVGCLGNRLRTRKMFEYPIHELALKINNQLNQLEEQGYLNYGYVCGNTSLHVAAFFPDENVALAFAQKIIISGIDVQERNQFGHTPLHFAVFRRKHRLIETLLDAGANPNDRDKYGNTALHYAINLCSVSPKWLPDCKCPREFTHTDKWIVKKLLEYNVDVEVLNDCNESALMWAVMEDNLDVVKMLLRSNASTNYHSIEEETSALHLALSKRMPDIEMVYELLQHGAELDSVNELWQIPIDMVYEIYNLSPNNVCIAQLMLKMEILQEFDKYELTTYRFQQCESAEYPGLADFYRNCCNEIDRMKKDWMEGNFSVHDFVIRGPHKLLYNWVDRVKAYNHVFTKLKTGEYPIYCDVLLNRFERWYLKALFCKTYVSAKKESDQKEIVLNYGVLRVISSYLSKMEMFNFIPIYPRETKSQKRQNSLLIGLRCLLKVAFAFLTHLTKIQVL